MSVNIIYVHSTSLGMSRACIHLGIHDHPVSNGICHESLDIAYKCVVQEVMKSPTTTIMTTNKKFLTNYI